MNEKRLEIARRLVACPKWVWLPGMAYVSTRRNDKMRRGRLALAPNGGDCFKAAEDWYHGDEFEDRDPDEFGKWRWLPDLDDDLTRLGVLAVVRRACGHLACVESPAVVGLLRLSTDSVPWRVHFRGGIAIGDTEEEALLSALESAS